MDELTYEQTVEAAKPIRAIAEAARQLNVEYLTKCLDEMKKNWHFRESAMVLNPNPHTALQTQDLERSKIKGLELMIELAKNQDEILKNEVALGLARRQSNDLAKIFGM